MFPVVASALSLQQFLPVPLHRELIVLFMAQVHFLDLCETCGGL